MINRNNTPVDSDEDAASPNDAASPYSLIHSKLKQKIDLRPMNKNKLTTVTDFEAADDNASHDAMNIAPHAPNKATAPDAENKTSMRQ